MAHGEQAIDALSALLPLLLACGTALALDRLCDRAGLLPPNFRVAPGMPTSDRSRAAFARSAALVLMAIVFWMGVFAAFGMSGEAMEVPEELAIPDMFFLHGVFVVSLVLWYLLGFAGSGVERGTWRAQFGLQAGSIGREIGLGAAAGVIGWLGVILALLAVAGVLFLLGGEDAVPDSPPSMISLVVALPMTVRLLLSLSAGVVEETFFRGFLQPRVGVLASSVLFVLAHMSYGQPFLLLGVGLLSILFASLVIWRQNIWAAMSAHTVFDAIQLLIVIPAALRFLEQAEPGPVALALSWIAGIS